MKTLHLVVIAFLTSSGTGLAIADATVRLIDSGQATLGVISINQAAGTANQQANLRAIVQDGQPHTGHVQARIGSLAAKTQAERNNHSAIEGSAFAHSHGIIGINQSAGTENQSLNSFSASFTNKPSPALHAVTLDNDQLATLLVPDSATPRATATSSNSLKIDDTAFDSASGVIQINQIAGLRNQASNSINIRFIQP